MEQISALGIGQDLEAGLTLNRVAEKTELFGVVTGSGEGIAFAGQTLEFLDVFWVCGAAAGMGANDHF